MGLSTYIIQRMFITIPTFLGITLIVFGLIQMAPGNIVDFYMSANPETRMDMEKMQALEERLGLQQPVYIQYLKWLQRLVCFDFGYSFETSRKISEELRSRIGATALLFLFSHLLAWPIAILIGIVSAIKPNSLVDHLGRAGALIGLSLPAFWVGMALILLFGVKLRWFPIGGSLSIGVEYDNLFFLLRNRLWHLILPSTAIALQSIATTMRLTRAEMLEVLKKDYITAARAKGLTERKVYLKHALRNSLMPVVTLIGLSIGHIFSGAVLTETVFSWPGIGRYLVHAIHIRDYPTVMAVTVITSCMVLLANLLTDITYHWINPKVRY